MCLRLRYRPRSQMEPVFWTKPKKSCQSDRQNRTPSQEVSGESDRFHPALCSPQPCAQDHLFGAGFRAMAGGLDREIALMCWKVARGQCLIMLNVQSSLVSVLRIR